MAATNVISMEEARRRIVKNRKARAKGRHGLSQRAKRWLAGTSTRGTVLMVAVLAVLMVGVIVAGVTTASANNLDGTVAADTLP